MSRANVLPKYQVVTSGDMSASITSAITSTEYFDNVAFQVNLTSASSANGTLSVEVSVDHAQDYLGNVTVAGTWNAISLSPTPSIASGSPASYYIEVNQTSAPWIRLKYTRSSGSGTLNAFICGKKI